MKITMKHKEVIETQKEVKICLLLATTSLGLCVTYHLTGNQYCLGAAVFTAPFPGYLWWCVFWKSPTPKDHKQKTKAEAER